MTSKFARNIKKVLYRLKRRFPYSIFLYHENDAYDPATGQNQISRVRVYIKKAVLLPGLITQNFKYSASFMMANRDFQYGGLYDTTVQEVLVDAEDIPDDFDLNDTECFVVHNGVRFKIIKIVELEYNIGYYMQIQKTQGEKFFDIFDEAISDSVNITEGYDAAV